MSTVDEPTGLLLINLGTPASPSPRDVRRYLRQFLSDPRVLTMPAPLRWALLELVILPTRPRKSAAAYAKIWSTEGSPLLVHSRALAEQVQGELGPGYRVELAMRYGQPDVASACERLSRAGLAQLVVLPLFPQYSEAATGSAIAHFQQAWRRTGSSTPVQVIESFYEEPGFIDAFVQVVAPKLEAFAADQVLLSYHGLPESQLAGVEGGDASHCLSNAGCCDAIGPANRRCYRAHCFATSRALEQALGRDCTTSFQSRLGRARWIRPYTDEIVHELIDRGVRRLAVLCPAFVADCLETLEEIGIRLREQWLELGGEDLLLCPCPNAHPAFARWVAERTRREATS